MKTPLRYPGGKSRAVKHILPLIPKDCKELCSPFLGGGSLELAVAEEYGAKVYGYDLFKPLVWFWQALLEDPEQLLEEIEKRRQKLIEYTDDPAKFEAGDLYNKIRRGEIKGISREEFEDAREIVNSLQTKNKPTGKNLFKRAAQYYIVNRSSFSGATTSGGWSWKASWARMTPTTLDRLRKFKVKNFEVECLDFKEAIEKHPDAFLYCDPPYMLGSKAWIEEHVDERTGKVIPGYWTNREVLYGSDGDLHGPFNHQALHEVLSQRSNWVLSYNNCPAIRDLYKGYEIREAAWSYGMKNVSTKKMGSSSELLIIG
jgi:DNA adenine methylase|tara:strand:+ start:908 stop:1852 length:945 start_codon:yes stop_codon:yes gene_type:complete